MTHGPRRQHAGTPLEWSSLAARAGLAPGAPALLALSGGADSVALLHLAHRAQPLVAVHVDHGLRGAEAAADAAFCRALCARLGVPLEVVRLDLDPATPDLERRAREARYTALAAVARARALDVVLVAHHADDADETLLLRLLRGTHPAGACGPARRAPFPVPAPGPGAPLVVVRPLVGLRAGALRAWLAERGEPWREDASNASPRFTRNRVRHGLLPLLERSVGSGARASLAALADALAGVEDELARRAPTLAWTSAVTLGAPRVARTPVPPLRALAAPLRRRTLRRALLARAGAAPADAVLDALVRSIGAGARADHNLRRGFRLRLDADALALVAPQAVAVGAPDEPGAPSAGPQAPDPGTEARPLHLDAPLDLGGGRALVAQGVTRAAGSPPPRGAEAVELRLPAGLESAVRRGALVVRAPRPGDVVHPLGAPGRRPLRRFLADAGVPREDRGRVPLVLLDDEVLWVCGLRPAEPWRAAAGAGRRLRLELVVEAGHR